MITDDYAPIIPRLDSEAAHIVRSYPTTFGRQFEYGFVCAYDHTRAVLHSPTFLARGNRAQIVLSTRGLQAGQILLHTHPDSVASTPSDGDLAIAETARWLGIGFAVTDADASDVFLVTLPDRTPLPSERWTIGRRLASVGRLQLAWAPATEGAR